MARKDRAKNHDPTKLGQKLGDVASLLRSKPSAGNLSEQQTAIEIKRNVLADFCRLAGARLIANVDSQSADPFAGEPANRSAAAGNDPSAASFSGTNDSSRDVHDPSKTHITLPHLSPRMRQTLRLLLGGDGEKQIAQKLHLSQHTIHVYVKALYRGFGVNSRGELMSQFVAAGGSIAALDDPPALQRATG